VTRPGTRRRRNGDRPGGDHQKIGEVDHAGPAFGLFVLREHVRDRLGSRRNVPSCRGGALGVVARGREHSFGPVDLRRDVAHLAAIDPEAESDGGVTDQAQRVVDHLRHRSAEDTRREVLQLSQGCGVEGAGLHAVRTEVAQSGPQLARGPGGERDREQLSGGYRRGAHLIGDPVGDRSRLAGAGTGEHTHRASDGLSRGPLLGIQALEHNRRIHVTRSCQCRATRPGMTCQLMRFTTPWSSLTSLG
jgi:hypothetical protein